MTCALHTPCAANGAVTAGSFAGRERILATMVLFVHVGLLVALALRQAPTHDEPAHLAAGLSHWMLGRFDLYRVNPPLVRMVGAAAVWGAGCTTDWSAIGRGPDNRAEFEVGRDFIAANGVRSIWLMRLARFAVIPFSVLGAVICFIWAREAFAAPGSGLIALTMWCFAPSILAHGSLLTNDVPATAAGLAAAYAWSRYLALPTWPKSGIAGLLLGFAILTKTVWIMLVGLWPVLWSISLAWRSSRNIGRQTGQLCLTAGTALLVINALYLFEGTGTRLDSYEFRSHLLTVPWENGSRVNRFGGTWLGAMPASLPTDLLLGIDQQAYDFDSPGWSYYRGEWKRGGWQQYYLLAFLVKTTHGLQALLVLSALAWGTNCRHSSRWFLLTALVPAIAVVVLASGQTAFNRHFRYVLPALGPLFVLCGSAACWAMRSSWRLGLVAACVGGHCVSSLSALPDPISYFNELSGGPSQGHRWLLGSNLDWGQDLLALRDWQSSTEECPLFLAYRGYFDPAALKMDYRLPPYKLADESDDEYLARLPPGYYAVSAHFLFGGPGTAASPGEDAVPIERGAYEALQRLPRVPEFASRGMWLMSKTASSTPTHSSQPID